jgi:succinate dehydrogenase / fumarate reductase flavoprotein subunit
MNVPDGIEIIDANVLVIGGGFAGTFAALRAAELTDGVVLAEKAYVSRTGASVMSGGIHLCPLDGDDLDAWAHEFIVRGGYMGHQAWAKKLMESQRQRIKDYIAWDVPIIRDENGEIRRFLSRGMVDVRCMQWVPKGAMTVFRRLVEGRGATILDRICITDLLTEDGAWPTTTRVVGAMGFNVRDGRFAVIRAKQTVVCTGMLSTKAALNQIDNDSCDGTAMAYRAGAKLSDMEYTFGGTFTYVEKNFRLSSYNVALAHGATLINARGERFMEKYDPVRLERSELPLVIAAFMKELIDGRGPCYMDIRPCDDTFWVDLRKIGRGGAMLMSDKLPDPKIHPLLIEPTWGLMSGDGRGGIAIDISCRTSMPGLLAAGGCAKNSAIGTHGSAGAPTAWAVNSGWWAGDTAGRASLEQPVPSIPSERLPELRAAVFAPLARTSSSTPSSLHARLAKYEEAMIDSMALTEKTLGARVAAVDQILADCEVTGAADLHDLMTLNEARSVAEVSRLIYVSALDRTESREQFYRVEYPYTDDDAWYCWHLAFRGPNGTQFERQRLPFDEGDIVPPKRGKHLSSVAALMQGKYDVAAFSGHDQPAEKVAG